MGDVKPFKMAGFGDCKMVLIFFGVSMMNWMA